MQQTPDIRPQLQDSGPSGPDGPAPKDHRYRVQSLGRALDLLDLIAGQGTKGARLTDLARNLSISKAATHAMLQTLLSRDFVANVTVGPGRRYRLGLALADLGDQAIKNFSLADIAHPVLRDLTEAVGCTSRVAILNDGYAVVIGQADAPGAVRVDAALGQREMAHSSAVGKALLAALPAAQARAIAARSDLPQRTPHTITDVDALMDELDRVARRGYAIDDEEDSEGVFCVGTCIFDRSGAAAGAISFSSIKHASLASRLDGYIATLVELADRLSAQLGGPSGQDAWHLRCVDNSSQ